MVIDKLPKGSVLIVDDDPVIVQSLGRMLDGLGHIRFALSGAQALKLISEAAPDIVLLDADMPGMSGYEVCQTLKADPLFHDIPVIFITGHVDDHNELKGLEAGAVDFIGKPPKAALVQARVRAHLQLKLTTDELRRSANSDPLTGLANRRVFDAVLEREWDRGRRAGSPVSLLMVDIDHFKQFNDHLGHPEGDRCLVQVAHLIQRLAQRPADEVARVGGEEFVVLLPETDAIGAAHVAQRIVEGVAAMGIAHPASSVAPVTTVSIGVASIHRIPVAERGSHDGQPHVGPIDLIRAADKALYAAKDGGRNRYQSAGVLDRPPPH
ncbi:MAG: diguanylate cyclase [Acidobacteriota bacterium]